MRRSEERLVPNSSKRDNPLMNRASNLAIKDMEKAEILVAFFTFDFIEKVCFQDVVRSCGVTVERS